MTTFKDFKYFPKNKQNEVQIPCGRSIKHNKATISKFKAFPLLVPSFSYSKLLKVKCSSKGCLRYLKIWKYIEKFTYFYCWWLPVHMVLVAQKYTSALSDVHSKNNISAGVSCTFILCLQGGKINGFLWYFLKIFIIL